MRRGRSAGHKTVRDQLTQRRKGLRNSRKDAKAQRTEGEKGTHRRDLSLLGLETVPTRVWARRNRYADKSLLLASNHLSPLTLPPSFAPLREFLKPFAPLRELF
jgi:hypothetical protein